ncbi:hypothetical protein GCM10010517_61050 [Streptosporangium fragile]|uniref:Uncharacterized protein n=1 Tax=Streptosporangium fragile TaxID=46186 RepID=A0ABN3W5L3_9ACTN
MRIPIITSLTALLVLTGGAGSALAADAQAPGQAVNLRLTAKVRAALVDTYVYERKGEITRSKVDGPTDVYYGKITGTTRAKDVYWAVGSISTKGELITYQGGPHVWRKNGNGAWRYVGNSGGCPEVSRKLLRLWKRTDLICD